MAAAIRILKSAHRPCVHHSGRGLAAGAAASIAIKIAGQGSVEVRDKDADFPSRGALNIDAARGDFGFDPRVDVEEGFQRYHDWFKASPYWKLKI